MEDLPLISFFEAIPTWAIGIICGLIPTIVALWRKQLALGAIILLISVAVGFFGGWLIALGTCFLLFLFAITSPSSGTGIFSIGVFTAICGVVLYAVELRFSQTYKKLNLPSLVGVFGEPKGADPRLKARMYRTFTAPDGRTMRARIEAFDGTNVTIVRKDGQRFTTTLDRFSEDDQEFIRAFNEAPAE